jgi:hypothetical protein
MTLNDLADNDEMREFGRFYKSMYNGHQQMCRTKVLIHSIWLFFISKYYPHLHTTSQSEVQLWGFDFAQDLVLQILPQLLVVSK